MSAVGPTARDVAALADVSVSTVSRVLSSPELVAASTRDRVMAAVTELQYRPNWLAQSLTAGRTKKIGLVVPDLQNPYFTSLAKGVQGRAWDGGYLAFVAFVADSDEDLALETALVQTLAEQVDGVILCSVRSTAEQIGSFAQQAEVVVLNRHVPGVASISVDNHEIVRIAVRHLRALGHDVLAYAGGPRNSWSDAERRQGLAACTEEFPEVGLIDLGHFSPNQIGSAAAADLAAASGASAAICFNDLVAIGLINRLRVRGLQVPRDLSVVGIRWHDGLTAVDDRGRFARAPRPHCRRTHPHDDRCRSSRAEARDQRHSRRARRAGVDRSPTTPRADRGADEKVHS